MTGCKLGRLVETLPAEDAALVRTWTSTGLDSRDQPVSGDAMAQALVADGHQVGPTTVKDHRAGRCACTRERTEA